MEKDREGNDITVSKDEFIRDGSKRNPKPDVSDDKSAGVERIGLISDMTLSAAEMSQYKRNHWKIDS